MASDRGDGAQSAPLQSITGVSALGEPLSINRAPAKDLSPWIARVYATVVNQEPDQSVECRLLADTPVLRVLFSGKWTAQTRDGHQEFERCALFFGPQTKCMPITVTGSFAAVTVALTPGAVPGFNGPEAADTLDRILRYDGIYSEDWTSSDLLIEWFNPDGPPERWLSVAEKLFRQLLEYTNGRQPDPIVAAFDKAAFLDPNMAIGDFAQEHAIERRTFERLIKKQFGMTPKQVLRRARALDIAANLRGVADSAEAEELALRYYDQSHLIREFSAFFGMTPKQFARTPQPLLTISLEARQARRLEVLGRIDPNQGRPWQT